MRILMAVSVIWFAGFHSLSPFCKCKMQIHMTGGMAVNCMRYF